jgi:hypothetical protein
VYRAKPLIILGCGPIGLLCAIRGRQVGLDVEIYSNGTPQAQAAPRLECVPSQFVALLVEFGISPKRAGIDRLHRTRTMQWSSRAAITLPAPDAAHIERPALDIALLQTALQAGAKLDVLNERQLGELQQRHRENRCLLLDATGRAALTARRRTAPKRPPVARLFHLPTPKVSSSDLMIAAGPAGYAYRLGNATMLTLGAVGRRDFVRGDSRQIVASIAEFAPWLVQDIPREYLEPGASGPAGVQWSDGDSENGVRVGDAAFARDALASQGLAIGLSDALKALIPNNDGGAPSHRLDERAAVALHCRRIAEQIAGSRFSAAPHWAEYSEFLARLPQLMAASPVGPAPMPAN